MAERPPQRPEGRLLAAALKRSGKSGRAAADEAGMSEGHWRAIVSGARSMGTGTWVEVRGPADTLARMAAVLGVPPADLAAAGRPDAAEELRRLTDTSAALDAMEADIEEVQAILERLRARGPAQVDTAVRVLRALAEESDAG